MRDSDVAADGSPVAIYLILPPFPGFLPLVRAISGAAKVLDLGCGVGRSANWHYEAGYDVVAVDCSPRMLTHVAPRLYTVCCPIERLALRERFDGVVLVSHLVNTGDDALRDAFVATCAQHIKPDGRVFIERYDPEWFATVKHHQAKVRNVIISL